MELADQFWLRSCQTKLIAGLAQWIVGWQENINSGWYSYNNGKERSYSLHGKAYPGPWSDAICFVMSCIGVQSTVSQLEQTSWHGQPWQPKHGGSIASEPVFRESHTVTRWQEVRKRRRDCREFRTITQATRLHRLAEINIALARRDRRRHPEKVPLNRVWGVISLSVQLPVPRTKSTSININT